MVLKIAVELKGSGQGMFFVVICLFVRVILFLKRYKILHVLHAEGMTISSKQIEGNKN